MRTDKLVLGIDLGTSGIRIAIIDLYGELIYTAGMNYPNGLDYVEDWVNCLIDLIKNLPIKLKNNLSACSIDGTSGTILACDSKGSPLGNALPYYMNCIEQRKDVMNLCTNDEIETNSISSLRRSLALISKYGANILLRHQADWLTGWLIDDWKWGEESNNLKLGWDIICRAWPKSYKSSTLYQSLPLIVPSGKILKNLSLKKAQRLGLPKKMLVISGTTDSNAAVVATNAEPEDGITVLGSTIVIKRFVERPLNSREVTNHLIGSQWIAGGASNAGGAVLKKFFTNEEIDELSRQINPEKDSGINLLPLPFVGERFPVNDPFLKPVLEPRPISDSLYLQALLEGLTRIESLCWEKLHKIGAPKPKKIITIGGGARNIQWRRMRERIIKLPITTCTNPPALGTALIALRALKEKSNSV